MNQLNFVNHACFYIANDTTLLLVDPWVEGAVFNNGWSLLDNNTSNSGLVRELAARQLDTYIWYSHEHPDHFSIGFIKKLKQDFAGKVTILFQHTKDKRVVTFLRRSGFEVIECLPGEAVRIDDTLRISVFPYADGDSYCLINSGERAILNINDCALTSPDACRAVRASVARLAPQIDVLFTQFGYANWVGNPFEPELRRRAAAEKRHRIALQMEILKPVLTIPFASFVTFASDENNYMNDHQNSAYTIRQWSTLSPVTESLRLMKPGDAFDLDLDTPISLAGMSYAAALHWKKLGEAPREVLLAEPSVSAGDVEAAFAKHLKSVRGNLPGLSYALEKLGLIKPLVMYIADIHLTARFSYVSGYTVLDTGASFDISMTSPSVVFLFSNEYGFNTTHVNGRFRTASPDALQRFSRFFMPQNMGRQGYGIGHPLATAGHLAGNVLGRLKRI
ncbi:MAG: MBL fold metallo-hydrolase [Pseudomonadota bacterium]